MAKKDETSQPDSETTTTESTSPSTSVSTSDTEQPKPTEDKVSQLEKQLGELAKTVGEQNDFIQGASVVINTLAYTPELRSAFQETIRKQQQGVVAGGSQPGQQPQQSQTQTNTPAANAGATGASEEVNQRVTGVEEAQREEIVREFEKEYGIGQMKDEERKEARRNIESYLNEFGWSVRNVPLPRLRNSLEKAYTGTHAERLRQEGRLEGIAQARNNAMASMPTLSGNNINESGQVAELTPAQKAWVKKAGVDEAEATKAYFNRDQEETRIPRAELKAKEEKEGKK